MTEMEKLRDISTALSHGPGTYPGMVLALCDEVERLRSLLSGDDDISQSLIDENERLRDAIRQTLNENAHLADGDVCTLIALKRALPDWELPEC